MIHYKFSENSQNIMKKYNNIQLFDQIPYKMLTIVCLETIDTNTFEDNTALMNVLYIPIIFSFKVYIISNLGTLYKLFKSQLVAGAERLL